MLATSALLLALSWGGVRYAWTSPQILGLAGASLLLWALFAARLTSAPEPLIPLHVLSNQVVAMGTLAACFGMGAFIGLSIFVPIYMEGVLRLEAGQSGLALVPQMIGTVAGATLSGQFMSRMKHYKRIPIIGLSCAALFALVLALALQNMPLWLMEALLAGISIGLGTVLPITTVSIQNAVAMQDLGTATASMNFFRSLGGAILVAVFGAIVLGTGGGLHAGQLRGLSPEQAAALAETFRLVFAAAALCLALSLAFVLRMRELPLRGGETSAAVQRK